MDELKRLLLEHCMLLQKETEHAAELHKTEDITDLSYALSGIANAYAKLESSVPPPLKP